jgi:predicted small metal-binding protein
MGYVVHCPCGAILRGKDEDEIVANVKKHAAEVHNEMQVSREQALAMAKPE